MHRRMESSVWSVILAGGEGERIKPLVMRWLGRHQPKQYCTFIGTRSMFEHTLDRADRVTNPERKVTVVARSHREETALKALRRSPGIVVEQPANRDTAAGILLPLAFIKARDPKATVVVYPSDHFVFPEERFVEVVRSAIQAAQLFGNRLVLLGVPPTGVGVEYGWIHPGAQIGCAGGQCLRRVANFCEKPGLDYARAALNSGALWNTLVFAASVELLWNLGWSYLPELMPQFEALCASIGTPTEQRVLEYVYRMMPARNFSSHLLAHATSHAVVMEMADVIWSDWGRAERIVDTLSLLGKTPSFPLECMAAS
jgi:mannose-1-phosphate guanylyltransferase